MSKAMNKAIIKFDLYIGAQKRHTIKMKFPTNNSVRLKGEVVECINYESRSGLHWSKCYRIDEKHNILTEYYSSVRKLKTIAMIAPMVYEDTFKPIPREGKNVVRIDVDTYKKLQIALLLLMNNILINNRNILLYCDEDVAEVNIVQFYDYRIKGLYIDSQSNLEIYWIERIPKNVEMKRTAKVEIAKHTIEFSRPAMISKAETIVTSRYDIEAAIFQIQPGTEILLSHPEHGEKKLNIDDYRMTTLLALHISSKYVE